MTVELVSNPVSNPVSNCVELCVCVAPLIPPGVRHSRHAPLGGGALLCRPQGSQAACGPLCTQRSPLVRPSLPVAPLPPAARQTRRWPFLGGEGRCARARSALAKGMTGCGKKKADISSP